MSLKEHRGNRRISTHSRTGTDSRLNVPVCLPETNSHKEVPILNSFHSSHTLLNGTRNDPSSFARPIAQSLNETANAPVYGAKLLPRGGQIGTSFEMSCSQPNSHRDYSAPVAVLEGTKLSTNTINRMFQHIQNESFYATQEQLQVIPESQALELIANRSLNCTVPAAQLFVLYGDSSIIPSLSEFQSSVKKLGPKIARARLLEKLKRRFIPERERLSSQRLVVPFRTFPANPARPGREDRVASECFKLSFPEIVREDAEVAFVESNHRLPDFNHSRSNKKYGLRHRNQWGGRRPVEFGWSQPDKGLTSVPCLETFQTTAQMLPGSEPPRLWTLANEGLPWNEGYVMPSVTVNNHYTGLADVSIHSMYEPAFLWNQEVGEPYADKAWELPLYPERPLRCHNMHGECRPIFCQHYANRCFDLTYNVSCQFPSYAEIVTKYLEQGLSRRHAYEAAASHPARDGPYHKEHEDCPPVYRAGCIFGLGVAERSIRQHVGPRTAYFDEVKIKVQPCDQDFHNHYGTVVAVQPLLCPYDDPEKPRRCFGQHRHGMCINRVISTMHRFGVEKFLATGSAPVTEETLIEYSCEWIPVINALVNGVKTDDEAQIQVFEDWVQTLFPVQAQGATFSGLATAASDIGASMLSVSEVIKWFKKQFEAVTDFVKDFWPTITLLLYFILSASLIFLAHRYLEGTARKVLIGILIGSMVIFGSLCAVEEGLIQKALELLNAIGANNPIRSVRRKFLTSNLDVTNAGYQAIFQQARLDEEKDRHWWQPKTAPKPPPTVIPIEMDTLQPPPRDVASFNNNLAAVHASAQRLRLNQAAREASQANEALQRLRQVDPLEEARRAEERLRAREAFQAAEIRREFEQRRLHEQTMREEMIRRQALADLGDSDEEFNAQELEYLAYQAGIRPEDLDTAATTAHAGNWVDDVKAFFALLLNLRGPASMLSFTHSAFMVTKDVSSMVKFLFECMPLLVQAVIFEKFPSIITNVLYHQSGWKKYHGLMDSLKKKLEKPTTTLVTEAERLLAEIKAYLRIKCAEPWTQHVEGHVSEFAIAVRNARTNLNACTKGKTPLMVVVAGAPGIGKTRFVNQLNSYLAGLFTGTPNEFSTYQVPPGQFWEKISETHIGVTFPEFLGVGEQTNLKQAEAWMALGDGPYKAEAASIERKDVLYEFCYATAASNKLYPDKISGFTNTMDPIWRRCDVRLYVKLADGKTAAQALSELKALPRDQQARFPHLRFVLVSHIPVNAAKINQYNHGTELDSTLERRYDAILEKLALGTGQDMTYVQVLKLIREIALARTRDTSDMTIEEGVAVRQIFNEHNADPLLMAPSTPPLIMDLEKLEKDEHWKWIKIALAIGAAVSTAGILAATIVGVYKALHKEQKEEAEAQYGGRPRDFAAAAQRRRLGVLNKLGTDQRKTTTAQAREYYDEFDKETEEFVARIRRQQVYITDVATGNSMGGFLIDQRTVVTLSHAFRDRHGTFLYGNHVQVEAFVGEGTMIYDVLLEPSNVTLRDSQDDLMYLRLSIPIPGIRKSSGLFATKEEASRTDSFLTLIGPCGRTISGFQKNNINVLTYTNVPNVTTRGVGTYAALTVKGDCGSAIVANCGGQMRILGIHVGGAGTFAHFVYLHKEQVANQLCTDFEVMPFHETAAQGHLKNYFTEYEPLPIPIGNFAPCGTLKHPPSMPKFSQLKKTRFHDAFPAFPCRVRPSALKTRIIPIMEEKYGIRRFPMPADKLKWAEVAHDMLNPAPKEALRTWTLEIAVNAIPRDASVGFGWNKRRKDLLIPIDGTDLVAPHPELATRVAELWQHVANRRLPQAILTPCLKDEARPHEKVDKEQTRTFQISPLEFLVFGTQVLGAYMQYKHERPIFYPSTVGMDVGSIEWHRVFIQLLDFSRDEPFLVDLDYAKMEATGTWQYYESYLRDTTRYYKDEGEETWWARRAYLMWMCQSLMAVDRSVYNRGHGNPSGMEGTTDFNTYMATVYAAYAFHDNYPDAYPSDFKALVQGKFCGDDTVLAVRPLAREKFNFFTIRDSLAKLNVTITPAKKNEEPKPNISQLEVQFCKKRILYSDELRALVPYVDGHTLFDQLSWCRDPTDAGMVQCINSALQWAFFTGDRIPNGQIPLDLTFTQFRDMCASLYPELEENFVTYEVLYYRFTHPRILKTPIYTMSSFSTTAHCERPALAAATTNAQGFGISLGPFHLGFGDEPDPHAEVTPPAADPINPKQFMPPQVNSVISSVVDTAEALAMSGKGQHLLGTAVSTGIHPGEMIHPGFNHPSRVVNLADRANTSTNALPKDFMQKEDEMSHAFFIHKPTIIDVLDAEETYTVEKELSRYYVFPFISPITADGSTEHYLAPIEFLSYLHAFWKGSLNYRIQYVGPRESGVRVAVTLLHGTFPTNISFADARQYPTIYFTFDPEHRSFPFPFSDVNPIEWKLRPDLTENGYSTVDITTSNGTLVFWQVSPVTGISIPMSAAPYFNIWMEGGSDFSLRVFQPCPNMTNEINSSLKKAKSAKELPKPRYCLHCHDSLTAPGPLCEKCSQNKRALDEIVQGFEVLHAPLPVIPNMATTAQMAEGEGKVPELVTEQAATAGSAAPEAAGAGTVTEAGENADTLVAVEPVTAPGTSTKPLHSNVEAVELTKIGSKFISLPSLLMNSANNEDIIASYDLPTAFLTEQAALITKTGRFYRGNLRVRFTPTSGSFSQGIIFAYWNPYKINANIPNIYLITSKKHVVIDLASNKPVDLYIPYAYAYEYYGRADIPAVLPDFGTICLYQQGFAQPTTNAKAIMLHIQYRWEQLEVFVPFTVPPCSVGTEAKKVRTRRLRSMLKHAATIAQSGKGQKLGTSPLASTVTSDAPSTPAQQRQEKLVSPLVTNHRSAVKASLADQMTRPTPYYSGTISLAHGTNYFIPLSAFPDTASATYVNDGATNLLDILKVMYAAFKGDTVFDIFIKDPENVVQYVVTAMTELNPTPEGLTAMLPIPYNASDYWPARIGAATAPTDSYSVQSVLPITFSDVPGKIRVVIPYRAQSRYTECESWADDTPVRQCMQGQLLLWNPSAKDTDVSLTIYRAVDQGARLAHFTGIPRMWFDHVVNSSETKKNYFNTQFTI